jgi:MFS family permease
MGRAQPMAGHAALSARRWRRAGLAAYLTAIIVIPEKSLIGVVIADPEFRRAVVGAHHYGQLGLLSSAFILTFGLSMWAWGWVIDRRGLRFAGMLAAVLMMAAEAGAAVSHHFWELVAARLGAGVAEGFVWPFMLSVARYWMGPRERSLFVALIFTVTAVGEAIFTPLDAYLVRRYGWPGPFWWFGLLALGLLMYYGWGLAAQPTPAPGELGAVLHRGSLRGEPVRPVADGPLHRRLGTVLGDGRYWAALVLLLANNVTVFGYFTWAPTYFVAERHMSLFRAAAALGFLGLAEGVILNPLFGWVQDRTDRRGAVAAMAALVLIAAVAAAVTVPNPYLSAACLSFLLIPSGQLGVAANSTVLNLVEEQLVGRATGVMNTVTQTLSAAAPWVMGVLITAVGAPVGGMWLLIGVSGVAFGAALPLIRQKR